MAGKNDDWKKDIDWKEQVQKFRGEGKVKTFRLETKAGFYRVYFDDNGKAEHADFKERSEADEFLIEFGGKNEETIHAPAKCLRLDGSWNADFLDEQGHLPRSITIQGSHTPKGSREEIRFGKECGYTRIKDTQGIERNTEIIFIKNSGYRQAVGELTINFVKQEEFNQFVDNLTKNDTLNGLTWSVKRLVTFAQDAQKECVFVKKKAGDRSQRMILKLEEIGGVSYTELPVYDIYFAADGMAEGVCRHIPMPKKPKEQRACLACVDNEEGIQKKNKKK